MTERKRYRYRDLKPGDAYYEAWDEYGKRMIMVGLHFFSVFALVPVLLWLDRCGFDEVGIPVAFGIWCVPGWILGARAYWFWRCPRCGETFDSSLNPFKFQRLYRATCIHCDLPKWAPRDPDKIEIETKSLMSSVLGRTETLEQIEALPDVLRELGVTEVLVKFGEGCLGGVDTRDASKPVGLAEIVPIVKKSIMSDVYVLGNSDLHISCERPPLDILFCHHSDIHVTAEDAKPLSVFEQHWRASGLSGYVEQDEGWLRFDGKPFSHPEADPESGHSHD